MSSRFSIDSAGVGQTGGVGGVSGGSSASDVDLGQVVGGMGAMNLLGTQRSMNLRANAIDLSLAIDQGRKSTVKQVIASLSPSDA